MPSTIFGKKRETIDNRKGSREVRRGPRREGEDDPPLGE
jgi:hypothetical protein